MHIGHLFKLNLGQQSIQVNFAIVDLRNHRITVFLVDDLFGIDQVDYRRESNQLIDLLQNEL